MKVRWRGLIILDSSVERVGVCGFPGAGQGATLLHGHSIPFSFLRSCTRKGHHHPCNPAEPEQGCDNAAMRPKNRQFGALCLEMRCTCNALAEVLGITARVTSPHAHSTSLVCLACVAFVSFCVCFCCPDFAAHPPHAKLASVLRIIL
jgi:hypothetical protein